MGTNLLISPQRFPAESTEGVDEYHGEEHEDGEDEEGDLAPSLQFATEDDGVEAALLEACSTVLMVMMVVVFRH